VDRYCRLLLVFGLSLGLGLELIGCGAITGASQVVSAQVSRMTEPNLTTATVLVGKASISLPDPMTTPDPWDTTFATNMFPLWLTPTTGATVTLNSASMPERINGVYFDLPDSLPYLTPCNLNILLSDQLTTITAHAVLPDSFHIVRPSDNESLGLDSLRVVWTHSDSCQLYTVQLAPDDTTVKVAGFLRSLSDTTVMVPKLAFADSVFHDFLSGNYHVTVWALNGGWKRGIDIIRNAGNVHGAIGLFGAATYPRPVHIRVR
jgi:hypothetical protein